MEITLRKFELLQELALIQGVVERKTTIPILGNALFRAEGDDLRIVATDMEIGFKSKCPAKVSAPGAVTLPAKRLFDIVRALPDKEIRIKQGDGNWVAVTCGSSRFRMAGLPQEDFPAIADYKSILANVSAEALSKLIARTIFAISAEDSKYTLSGALLIVRPQGITMVATDGHRLSYVEKTGDTPGFKEEFRILVPRKAMGELARMISEGGDIETVGLAKDDNHLFFEVGPRLLVSRVLTGQFPNYEAVLPKTNDRSFTLDREEFASVIRRVAILADERSRTVRLHLTPGNIEFSASNSDLGEAHESLPVDYEGDELQVGFNYQYLLDFLTTADDESVRFEFKDSESATQLRANPSGDFSYRYVVMPMRI